METENVVAEVAGEQLVIRAKQLRGNRTLSEIAARMGMRQDDLGKIERGETKSIQYETLLKLCAVFEVTPSQLFTVESSLPRKANPLERVLAGIEAGTIQTHKVGPRARKLRPAELKIDLGAASEFSDFEEPAEPRRRRQVPPNATN